MTPTTFAGRSQIVGIVECPGAVPVGYFSPDAVKDALSALAAFGWGGETIELASDPATGRLLIRPQGHVAAGWIAVAPIRETPPPHEEEKKAPAISFDTGFPAKQIDPPKKEEKPETKAWTGATTVRPLKAPEGDAPTAAPTANSPGEVCADCGAPVSKTQAKMSMMFVNRPLCKACLDKIKNGVRA